MISWPGQVTFAVPGLQQASMQYRAVLARGLEAEELEHGADGVFVTFPEH